VSKPFAGVPNRRIVVALLLCFAAACAPASHPRAQTETAPLAVEPLDVVTSAGKTYHFKVEIADNEATRERGLMFRTSLAPDAGMLFDFKAPQEVAFWMKNTFIPLDIIFIAPDGHILNIAKKATPMSEANLPSDGRVLGVLEIAGGRADELGIGPGDVVRHRIFPAY
jgi:uncharacterized membrane protein (UPF0127 family)